MEETRRIGESDSDFAFRICCAHDKIGTWQDVADVLNNELGTSRTAKTWKNIYNSWKFMDNNASRKSADTERYEGVLREIRREKAQLSALKRDLLRAERENDRRDLFYQQLLEAVENCESENMLSERAPIALDASREEYILAFGDVHYGAQYDTADNVYNADVCAERFAQMRDHAVRYLTGCGASRVKVLNVGDTVQGILRMKDIALNETSVVMAIVEVSRIIAEFLDDLSEHFFVEYYHVPTANHSQTRPLGSKANELSAEDVEQVIVHYIHDLLRNNHNVQCHIPDNSGSVYFEVCGRKVLALHGHQYGISSIENIAKDYSARDGVFYDTIILGHTHAAREYVLSESVSGDIEALVVPAFCGTDPYSDSILKRNRPAARIYRYNEDIGHAGTEKIMLN